MTATATCSHERTNFGVCDACGAKVVSDAAFAAALDRTKAAASTPMVQRNLRVPRDLWDEAARHGAQEDPPRGVSDIVRDALDAYNTKQRKRKR